MPRLMKQLNVKNQRELEQELSRLGSSLADARRSFNEQVIATEWIRSKVKINEEVSPDEMLEYYRDHLADYDFPTQARWEELMVRKNAIPEQRQQAYAELAQMGNEVWPRLAANPAPARRSSPKWPRPSRTASTPRKGGVHDWTTKGALKATASTTRYSRCRSAR